MKALTTILREIAGLFVEDRYFAIAIALWLTCTLAALVARIVPVTAGGAVLFGGLALILLASVARAAHGSDS